MATKPKAVEATTPEVIVHDIDGLSKDEAMTKLIGEIGLTFKEATEYWKASGSTVKGGVFQATLDWLQSEPRTQSALAEFILANGTANEARWFGQRDAIRKLSVAVFKAGGVDFTEVEATTKLKEALKATYAK